MTEKYTPEELQRHEALLKSLITNTAKDEHILTFLTILDDLYYCKEKVDKFWINYDNAPKLTSNSFQNMLVLKLSDEILEYVKKYDFDYVDILTIEREFSHINSIYVNWAVNTLSGDGKIEWLERSVRMKLPLEERKKRLIEKIAQESEDLISLVENSINDYERGEEIPF